MTTPPENVTKKRLARSCPECKSTHLVERLEEECNVCLNCGFVISAETANRISERRTSAYHPKLVRPTSHPEAVSSVKSKELIHENMVRALDQWRQVKTEDSMERNLAIALQYTTKMAIDLSLPKTALEKASLAYKRIIEEGLLKGRSMTAICAAAVYIGCKQCRTAITIKDIAHASRISPRKISHSYRSIAKHLNFSMQPTSVTNHAIQLSNRLQASTRTRDVVEKTIKALDCSKRLIGKDPAGIACAAIYIGSLLAGERRTQREIAEVARITEATIRARCRELERSLIFNIHL